MTSWQLLGCLGANGVNNTLSLRWRQTHRRGLFRRGLRQRFRSLQWRTQGKPPGQPRFITSLNPPCVAFTLGGLAVQFLSGPALHLGYRKMLCGKKPNGMRGNINIDTLWFVHGCRANSSSCQDIMVGSMYQAQIPPLSPYCSQGRGKPSSLTPGPHTSPFLGPIHHAAHAMAQPRLQEALVPA